MNNFLIGCVGKPSAGKSSFLNAATEANAKVGNYPFTTIEPNIGVTFFPTDCPCKKYGKTELCAPRYGECRQGQRRIPVKVLDVAGLVPGASEGQGLGNKFLDDLRQAHVLLHVVDVSGRTNEKGEETTGYDPLRDVDWLQDEIHSWIFQNLWRKWVSTVRRHVATKSSAAKTLQTQLSGYGANLATVSKTLSALDIREPSHLEEWDEAKVRQIVRKFMDIRFPTVLVLNKIDVPEADANISKICKKYDENKIILSSALAECFLKKMRKDGFIRYSEGEETFETAEDEPNGSLKPLDEKMKKRLDNVRDLVLFRYGSTGVQDAIKKAVECRELIPVYPVKNIHNFSCDDTKKVFRDCALVPPGTTVRELCGMLSGEMEKHFLYAEGVSGQRLGEDEEITPEKNIIKFTTAASVATNVTHKKETPKNDPKAKSTKKQKEEED